MENERYSIQDVISIFNLKELKDLPGHECFFAHSIEDVIEYANYGYSRSVLVRVNYDSNTFLSSDGNSYQYLIPKKKKFIRFRPFRTTEEFIREVQKRTKLFYGLDTFPAIWIKNIKHNFISAVTCICMDKDLLGIVHLLNQSTLDLYQLFYDYLFFDGTPCGMIDDDKEESDVG